MRRLGLGRWWERERVPDDGAGFWVIMISTGITVGWFAFITLVLPGWQ
jgi:hypothetical protein